VPARTSGRFYRGDYDALKPQFGHWVIFDHCLPFDVSRAFDEARATCTAHLDRAARQGHVGGTGGLTVLVYAMALPSHLHSERLIRKGGLGSGPAPALEAIGTLGLHALDLLCHQPIVLRKYPYVTPLEITTGEVARTQSSDRPVPGRLGWRSDRSGAAGIEFIIVDDNNTVSVGSRAICYAKRALEILDRLGCGQRSACVGVSWSVGKVFFHDELAYRFDLLPELSHRRPAFVNLQQYHL